LPLEIEDPIVRDPGSRIEAGLLPPVELQARVGYLDDENGVRRMDAAVISPAPGHDRDVGLRLGILVERDGTVCPDRPAGAKGLAQRVLGEADGGGMGTALRFADDHGATDQLEALARSEGTQIDQPLVLDTGPVLGAYRGNRHALQASPAVSTPSTSTRRYSQQIHRLPLPAPAQERYVFRSAISIAVHGWSAVQLGSAANGSTC
jgi:hypothetical protein